MGAIEKAIARFNTVSDSTERQPAVPAAKPDSGQVVGIREPGNKKLRVREEENRSRTFTLPYKAMEMEGLLSISAPRNQLSEEYRAIKRPILAAIEAQTPDHSHASRNVIMVTSCVSGCLLYTSDAADE